MKITSFGFALVVTIAGCGSEPGIRNLVPVIAVAPDALHFGDVGPPQTETQQIFVTNSGGADLEIDEVTLTGGAGAFQFVVDTPFELAPGEEYALDVTFAPGTFREYSGTLAFLSDDEERPRASVRLTGRGVDLPFPDIEILPSRTVAPDWPDPFVPIGESALVSFEIWNQGDADLHLGDLTVADEYGAPAPQFVEIYGQSGNVIRPDQSTLVVFAYNPDDAEPDLGIVSIPSDDPDEPVTTVQLNGNEAIDLPDAEIDCPAEVLLTGPEWVPLSGAGSSDPAGYEPLLYSWTVTRRPDASDPDVPLDPNTTEEIELYVDVAGTWTVELAVMNTLGALSDPPAVCTFEAIPEDDLHVELSWDTENADIDLHLVQGGAALFDAPEDCNWCNRAPSWGVAGSDDDPRLDIDDRGGIGPENINILHPADGAYEVKVHYFTEWGDGPTVATVRVWLDGAEVWTGSQVLTFDEVWSVGTAEWAAATFTPVGTVADATRRECR